MCLSTKHAARNSLRTCNFSCKRRENHCAISLRMVEVVLMLRAAAADSQFYVLTSSILPAIECTSSDTSILCTNNFNLACRFSILCSNKFIFACNWIYFFRYLIHFSNPVFHYTNLVVFNQLSVTLHFSFSQNYVIKTLGNIEKHIHYVLICHCTKFYCFLTFLCSHRKYSLQFTVTTFLSGVPTLAHFEKIFNAIEPRMPSEALFSREISGQIFCHIWLHSAISARIWHVDFFGWLNSKTETFLLEHPAWMVNFLGGCIKLYCSLLVDFVEKIFWDV